MRHVWRKNSDTKNDVETKQGRDGTKGQKEQERFAFTFFLLRMFFASFSCILYFRFSGNKRGCKLVPPFVAAD
jgi:hypothetical protein